MHDSLTQEYAQDWVSQLPHISLGVRAKTIHTLSRPRADKRRLPPRGTSRPRYVILPRKKNQLSKIVSAASPRCSARSAAIYTGMSRRRHYRLPVEAAPSCWPLPSLLLRVFYICRQASVTTTHLLALSAQLPVCGRN